MLIISLVFLTEISAQTGGPRQPEEDIISVGSARILKDGAIAAKETAVREALAKALEIHILKKLGEKIVADNFNIFVYQIFPLAWDLTSSYKLLAEDRGRDTSSVMISARVNDMILEERLRKAGISTTPETTSRVILLISETDQSSGNSRYWWKTEQYGSSLTPLEAALYGSLHGMGLAGVNRMGSFPWSTVSETMKKEQLSDNGIIGWGNLLGADVAVYGKARVSDGRVGSVEIGVYDVSSSAMISKEMLSGDSFREVSAAARDIAERIVGAMGDGLTQEGGRINTLSAVFESVSGAGQVQKLSSFLSKDVQGVKKAVPLKLSRNSVSFSIEFQGDAERLRSAIQKNSALPCNLDFLRGDKGEVVFRLIEPSVQ
jgi:hypothetical protein